MQKSEMIFSGINNMKNAKCTIPFLALILLIPAGIDNSFAQESSQKAPIYDPAVVQYIKEIISRNGEHTQEKTIDGQTMSVTTNIQVTDGSYVARTTASVNDERIMSETFRIVANDDSTYKLINDNLGIDETFTDVSQGATGDATSSTRSSISLTDRECDTFHTLLPSDSYSACSTFNQEQIKSLEAEPGDIL